MDGLPSDRPRPDGHLPGILVRRLYVTALVVVWLAATAWLVTQKLLPPLMPGTPPETISELDEAERGQTIAQSWFLELEEERIGNVESLYLPLADGGAEVRSRVIFRNFPLRKALQSVVGALGSLLQAPFFDAPIDAEILTRGFYRNGRLDRLTLLAIYERETTLARFELTRAREGKYVLVALTPDMRGDGWREMLRREISLGDDADAQGPFAVEPRMLDLRVGQTWSEAVAKPFSSSGDVQLIEAIVDRQETLSWHGVPMRTHVVEYRRQTGVGDDRERPDAVVWVDEAGQTLQQDLSVGSSTYRMVRMRQEDVSSASAGLEELPALRDSFVERFDALPPVTTPGSKDDAADASATNADADPTTPARDSAP